MSRKDTLFGDLGQGQNGGKREEERAERTRSVASRTMAKMWADITNVDEFHAIAAMDLQGAVQTVAVNGSVGTCNSHHFGEGSLM